MTREEKLAAYAKAIRTVLEDVNQGHCPRFGVCGAVNDELISHPNYLKGLYGYEFCHNNAHEWPKAFHVNGTAANGKQFASSFFIEGPYARLDELWKGRGRALRIEFMEWLINRIEAGEAFVDETEAAAAGWREATKED